MRLHNISDYVTKRYVLLKLFEQDIQWAYADPKGIATFGIGLNLQVHGELLLQALGFDLGGTRLMGAALTAERDYGRRLIEAMNQPYPYGIGPTNAAKQALDAILQERATDPVLITYDPANFISYGAYTDFNLALTTEFRIDNDAERAELFRLVMDGYAVPDVNGNTKSFTGYERQLDTWLEATGVSLIAPELLFLDSKERLALQSLMFNGKTYARDQPGSPWNDTGLSKTLGTKLPLSLLNGDRAEAWYEIRYNTNLERSDRTEKVTDLFSITNPLSNEI